MSFAVGPQFTLTGPPRWVPLLVRLRLGFGGALQQIGWAVLGIGSLLGWVLEVPQHFYQLAVFRGTLETAEAVVKKAEATRAKENKREVYQYTFEFKIGQQAFQGASYETGNSLGPGSRVIAEFPQGRPKLARIRGKRATLFGWPVMIFALVPIIGLTMILFGMRGGRRSIRLLRDGIQTTGRLVRRERTSTRINHQTVYRLIFEFRAEDGQFYEATAKTHLTENLLDDQEEPLLYLPRRPEFSSMLDHLPGSPRVDEQGEIRIARPFLAIFTLLLPLLVLGGNGAWIYHKYFA